MKSIIEFNKHILKDYKSFDDVNDNWTILSYLNYNYALNDALAFSKLFFPDFRLDKGCVILSFLYNENNFNEWYEEFEGNISSTEKMVNLYELKDFFHINQKSEDDKEKILLLGYILKKSWEMNLEHLFPERRFEVITFEEHDSVYITFYNLNQ